jgi:hypothetical protein
MRRFLAVFFLLVSSAAAQAIHLVRADGFTLTHGHTFTNEIWVLAPNVSVGGTVKDDFIAACVGGQVGLGNARLAGTFENDVWAFANAVDFTGTAAGHARFLAGEITMGGKVGISALALANTVTLTSNSVIKGDAVLVGQSVVVAGSIRGNLKILANTATLDGSVGGDVRIAADDIVVMPGTKIGGDLVYTSSKDLFLDPAKVQLSGQLIRKEVQTIQVKTPAPTVSDVLVTQAYFYLCALVAGIPFIAIFPRFTGRAVRHVRQSAWKCALVGVVALCLIPMTSAFVFLTIVGIPLAFLLLLAYAIMLYLSKIIVALTIGGIVLRRNGPQPFSRVFTVLSLGLIAIYIVTALPLVGSIAAFVVLLMGLGGMVFAIFSSQGAAELPPLMPPPVPASLPNPFESRNSANQEEPPKKE